MALTARITRGAITQRVSSVEPQDATARALLSRAAETARLAGSGRPVAPEPRQAPKRPPAVESLKAIDPRMTRSRLVRR